MLGLGGCAAAAEMIGIKSMSFDGERAFQAEYPHLQFLPTDSETHDAGSFLAVCERLATQHSAEHGPHHRVMIVAHREGLRLFSPLRGIPYCGTLDMAFAEPRQWAVQSASFPLR